jgi:hypothetical protein
MKTKTKKAPAKKPKLKKQIKHHRHEPAKIREKQWDTLEDSDSLRKNAPKIKQVNKSV